MRLTKQYIAISSIENSEQKCINKLGQLEDIEEELGIDLIVFFTALAHGFYGIDQVYKIIVHVCDFEYNAATKCFREWKVADREWSWYYLKGYGKTWALTKEELE